MNENWTRRGSPAGESEENELGAEGGPGPSCEHFSIFLAAMAPLTGLLIFKPDEFSSNEGTYVN